MMWVIRNLIIPLMQIVLMFAGVFTAIELMAYYNPNKVWGYSSEDAAWDVYYILVSLLLWDRFFGPYSVTLRRMAKLIDARHKEAQNHG